MSPARAGAVFQMLGRRPRRGVRRHRQRRRRRRGGGEQQRQAPAADQRGRRAQSLDRAAPRRRDAGRDMLGARVAIFAWTMGRRCGAGLAPTAAMRRRTIRECSSGSVSRRSRPGCASSGPAARRRSGRRPGRSIHDADGRIRKVSGPRTTGGPKLGHDERPFRRRLRACVVPSAFRRTCRLQADRDRDLPRAHDCLLSACERADDRLVRHADHRAAVRPSRPDPHGAIRSAADARGAGAARDGLGRQRSVRVRASDRAGRARLERWGTCSSPPSTSTPPRRVT